MASKAINTLANRAFEIKMEQARLQNELDGITAKLLKAGPQTMDLDKGRIIITEATADRPSGTMNLVFDKDRFFQLRPDDAARESALASGIIKMEAGLIKGRQSVVQISLRK
jgi:hypothetical protein